MWRKKSYRIISWTFPRKIGFALLSAAMMTALWLIPVQEEAIPAAADGRTEGDRLHDWQMLPSGRDSLLSVLPSMASYYGKPQGWSDGLMQYLGEVTAFCTGVRTDDLVSVIAMQFPYRVPVRMEAVQDEYRSPLFTAKMTGEVRVGIYHTHTAESFVPSSGKSHAAGGECGEIVEVGDFFVRCLAEKGVRAVQSKTIHDYPNFMQAYSASEKTAAQMAAQYGSLEMLFDIHRDASARMAAVSTVDGKPVAKVLIIVAQGQDGLPQPHWRENYRLAKAIERKMDELYPGLSGGIQLTEWRYNQHLHPHALLLEVGSHETSKGEAMRSMKLLADVLARLLAEGRGA